MDILKTARLIALASLMTLVPAVLTVSDANAAPKKKIKKSILDENRPTAYDPADSRLGRPLSQLEDRPYSLREAAEILAEVTWVSRNCSTSECGDYDLISSKWDYSGDGQVDGGDFEIAHLHLKTRIVEGAGAFNAYWRADFEGDGDWKLSLEEANGFVARNRLLIGRIRSVSVDGEPDYPHYADWDQNGSLTFGDIGKIHQLFQTHVVTPKTDPVPVNRAAVYEEIDPEILQSEPEPDPVYSEPVAPEDPERPYPLENREYDLQEAAGILEDIRFIVDHCSGPRECQDVVGGKWDLDGDSKITENDFEIAHAHLKTRISEGSGAFNAYWKADAEGNGDWNLTLTEASTFVAQNRLLIGRTSSVQNDDQPEYPYYADWDNSGSITFGDIGKINALFKKVAVAPDDEIPGVGTVNAQHTAIDAMSGQRNSQQYAVMTVPAEPGHGYINTEN